MGGGCLRQPVSGHVLPALLLAHGVGDPVCPLLQAGGALGEDLLLPQQEGAVLHLLDRGLHRLGIGDFLHGAYRQEGESTLVLVDGLGLGPEGFHGPGQFLGGLQDLKQCLDGWLGLLPGLGQALCQSLGAQNFRLGGEIAHHHVHGVVKIGGHSELVGVGIFDSLQGLVDGFPALAGADGETVNGENVLRFDLVYRLHQAGGELVRGLEAVLGGDGQGHGGLLGVAVIRPENLGDLVLHLPDRCLIGVLALDVGQRGRAVGGDRVAQGAGGDDHRPRHRKPGEPQQHPCQQRPPAAPGGGPLDRGAGVRRRGGLRDGRRREPRLHVPVRPVRESRHRMFFQGVAPFQ